MTSHVTSMSSWPVMNMRMSPGGCDRCIVNACVDSTIEIDQIVGYFIFSAQIINEMNVLVWRQLRRSLRWSSAQTSVRQETCDQECETPALVYRRRNAQHTEARGRAEQRTRRTQRTCPSPSWPTSRLVSCRVVSTRPNAARTNHDGHVSTVVDIDRTVSVPIYLAKNAKENIGVQRSFVSLVHNNGRYIISNSTNISSSK